MEQGEREKSERKGSQPRVHIAMARTPCEVHLELEDGVVPLGDNPEPAFPHERLLSPEVERDAYVSRGEQMRMRQPRDRCRARRTSPEPSSLRK